MAAFRGSQYPTGAETSQNCWSQQSLWPDLIREFSASLPTLCPAGASLLFLSKIVYFCAGGLSCAKPGLFLYTPAGAGGFFEEQLGRPAGSIVGAEANEIRRRHGWEIVGPPPF